MFSYGIKSPLLAISCMGDSVSQLSFLVCTVPGKCDSWIETVGSDPVLTTSNDLPSSNGLLTSSERDSYSMI